MIFYFTGTGNSKYVGEIISEITGYQLISLNDLIKKGEIIRVSSENPYIFICPTYGWRIPRLVEEYIERASFLVSKKVYFILTCGGQTFGAINYVQDLCKRKGFEIMGFSEVVMPENYIALFETPQYKEAMDIINEARASINRLGNLIVSGEKFPEFIGSGNFFSKYINPLFYKFIVKDKKFYISDGCISCENCKNICPVNNIEFVDNKPKWQGRCIHCMACISSCPKNAIEYGNRTRARTRYFLKNGKVKK